MSLRHRFAWVIPQAIFDEDELFDDATDVIPVIGLNTSLDLRDRFLRRLSRFLGANVKITEHRSGCSINISLARNAKSPQRRFELDELRQLLRSMKDSMKLIALYRDGSQCDRARDELWDRVLMYAYHNIDRIICSLLRCLNNNKDDFDNFITKMLGMFDVEGGGSTLDHELGDQLITFRDCVYEYKGSIKKLNDLIQHASTMIRTFLNLDTRLKHLLGKSKFANELYELICGLGFPERVYSTMVRAANSSKTFENITFHLKPVSPPKQVSFATVTTSKTHAALNIPSPPTPQSPPPQQEKSERVQRFELAAQPPLVKVKTDLWFDSARPYLPQEDRALHPFQIQPRTKQESAQLVGTVLRRNILPVQMNAWYTFGFVTAKDEAEERRLGGLYAVLLKEAQNPEAIFQELLRAVETNTLVKLFDIKGYGHFRGLFPLLENFLKTPPEKRWTVWRLKQYVQTDERTEPPACLRRDYGFKFCSQREEVERLKGIYTRMLRTMEPEDVHDGCVKGQLFEGAMRKGLFVDLKDKRLLKNDFPSPFVGFDNDKGLDNYRRPLFKKALQW